MFFRSMLIDVDRGRPLKFFHSINIDHCLSSTIENRYRWLNIDFTKWSPVDTKSNVTLLIIRSIMINASIESLIECNWSTPRSTLDFQLISFRSIFFSWIKINYDRLFIECIWSQNFLRLFYNFNTRSMLSTLIKSIFTQHWSLIKKYQYWSILILSITLKSMLISQYF